MAELDKRFALIRDDGRHWYAARMLRDGVAAFHVTTRGKSRDANGQTEERLTDVADAAERVLQQGKRIRFGYENGPAPASLDKISGGVVGYEIDPAIASKLGIPCAGNF